MYADNVNKLPFPPDSRIYEDFHDIQRIGAGAFGQVFRARNRHDCRLYAIKFVPIPKSKCSDPALTKEIKILSGLEHPNIMRYYFARIEPPCPVSQCCGGLPDPFDQRFEEPVDRCLIIQMELYTNGTLGEAINRGLYQDRTRCERLFHEAAKGLDYLHKKGVTHGDLHVGNLLLSKDDELKIADFGLSFHRDLQAEGIYDIKQSTYLEG